MISNIINIQLMQERNRWDFSSYHPNYERALKTIRSSKWKVIKLGELAKFFKYGASIPADYVEEGTIFLRAQNIREYGIDLSDKCYIDISAYSLDRYTVEEGDILITRSGINVGEAAVITQEYVGSVHGSYSIRLRLSHADASSEFIAFAINSPIIQAQIMALKSRSAQPNINIAELSSLRIIVPPHETQDHIVSIMKGAYKARREKLDSAKSLLEDIDILVLKKLGIDISKIIRTRSVIKSVNEIAGGRFDFEAVAADVSLDFNGLPPTPLRKIVKKISEKILTQIDCPDDFVNYISLANIASNTGELVDFSPVKGIEVLSSSTKFLKGDILFGRMRPYLNKVWIAEFDGICTGEAIVLRPDNNKVDTSFLHALLMSRLTLNQVLPFQSGTSLPRVSSTHILDVKLPIPNNINLQREISVEIVKRRIQAKQLKSEAEQTVTIAKAEVEKIILGEATE